VTSQSLDYDVGAGRMNLNAAFDQYVETAAGGSAGTTDVAGLGGGIVAEVGWDFGAVVQTAANVFTSNTYLIATELLGGSTFNATLSWFVERTGAADGFSGSGEDFFANLDLAVIAYDPLTGLGLSDVAISRSVANVVEHLSFQLPENGYYGLEVRWIGENWDFGDDDTMVDYGLAWSSVSAPAGVPEPGACFLVAIGLCGTVVVKRRRSQPAEPSAGEELAAASASRNAATA
ncbi:MAG: PEP-CTERM sorting domain-containing protein, partial [Planctomycetota bacterium]